MDNNDETNQWLGQKIPRRTALNNLGLSALSKCIPFTSTTQKLSLSSPELKLSVTEQLWRANVSEGLIAHFGEQLNFRFANAADLAGIPSLTLPCGKGRKRNASSRLPTDG